MAEAIHTGSGRLKTAVSVRLVSMGIRETTGPSVSHFEMNGGVVRYEAHSFGVTTKHLNNYDCRTNYPGRYREYQEVEDVVLQHLAGIRSDHKFLVWRSGPDLVVESGFVKAYLRYATVALQEDFDEAARQYAEQVKTNGR